MMEQTKVKQRNRMTADLTLVDVYKFTKKEINLKTKFYEVNQALFIKICSEFNDALMREHVINNPSGAKLPFKLGKIRIVKKKNRKVFAVNRVLSKQYKKEIVHFNDHTNGFYYKFVWEPENAIIKGRARYVWDFCRVHKRTLAANLLDEDKEIDFFE